MHYAVLVFIPNTGPDFVADEVQKVMKPFQNKHWDWYQIGGRWTGGFDGYEPFKDPRNIETCRLCNGTGMRFDAIGVEARRKNAAYTCNGCDGKGESVKWPTQWCSRAGDVCLAKEAAETGFTSYAFVSKGHWFAKETWNGDDFVPFDGDWSDFVKEQLLEHDGLAVIVDCHD
jgi:hypothetical protein